MRTKILLSLLLSLVFLEASAEKFDIKGSSFDEPMEVLVLPKIRFSGEVFGFSFYEVYKQKNIGTAFLVKTDYYTIYSKQVVVDRSYYRVIGFLTEDTVKINEKYMTKTWEVSEDFEKSFKQISRLVASTGVTTKELKKVYKSFELSPFIKNRAKKLEERELGEGSRYWFLGTQLIESVEIYLNRDPKYGNKFIASIIDK